MMAFCVRHFVTDANDYNADRDKVIDVSYLLVWSALRLALDPELRALSSRISNQKAGEIPLGCA
jgi:hypothetical protein